MKKIKAIIRKIRSMRQTALFRIRGIRQLQSRDFTVTFPHEGNVRITLPRSSAANLFLSRSAELDRHIVFMTRPEHEVLLRRIVYELFAIHYLDHRKSIVDIGCWIGDNALAWSRLLEGEAVVYAIDPSPGNLSFAEGVAGVNEIRNIRWVEAVCYDRPGLPLGFSGSLDHATFTEEAPDASSSRRSRTLDDVVPTDQHHSVSLLHIDVEGTEAKVIAGAEGIIRASRPVIIFEQHISKEHVNDLLKSLADKEYDVFMINEVLPGCDLDCRNFIAFPSERPLPSLSHIPNAQGRDLGVWFSCLGDVIIRCQASPCQDRSLQR
jgi:FkbM family methyltransferase